MIKAAEADCWIVESGDEETLGWFEGLGKPVFAIGGHAPRFPEMPGVGSLLRPVIEATVRRLADLGHQRIIFLIETSMHAWHRTSPTGFCAILENAGITSGPYNLPDWEETPDGLQALLESLFRVSPPTAIIALYPTWMNGVLAFMARRGLKTPDDVSLVCGCHEPTFDWIRPQIAHFRHGDEVVEKVLLEWAKRVIQGKRYVRKTKVKVELIEGGTLGPARDGIGWGHGDCAP
jgi:LacI family transcriptional regulator